MANLTSTLAVAISPITGGLLYAGLGLVGIALFDVITFALAATTMLAIVPSGQIGSGGRSDETALSDALTTLPRIVHTARAGLEFVKTSDTFRSSMPLILTVIFATSLEGVAGVYYLRQVAAGSAVVYGLTLMCWSVGAVAGALITAERLRLRNELRILVSAAAAISVGLSLAGAIPSPVIVGLAFLLGGLGNGAFNTAVRSTINVGEASRRPMAWGTFRALSSAAVGIGFVLGAPGLLFSPRAAVIAAGVLPIVALLALPRLPTGAVSPQP